MPESLGGLGLPSFFNTRTGDVMGPSDEDLLRGTDIYFNKRDKVATVTADAPWKIFQLAKASLPVKPYSYPFGSQRESDEINRLFDQTVGFLCVGLLFDAGIDMSDLMVDEVTDPLAALARNERLWARANFIRGRRAPLFSSHVKKPIIRFLM